MKKILFPRWRGLGGGNGIFILVILFLYVQVFVINTLHSQTTFNNEIKVMGFITNQGPVLIYKDTIICLGHGTDTTTFSEYSLFVAKFDLKGNFIKRYIDTLGDYYFSYINDAYIVGENVIFAADSYQYGEFWGSYIMVMRIATGEVVKKIGITNPKDQYDYGGLAGLTQIDSITYAAVSSIREQNKPNGKTFNDMQISIVNLETEEVKYLQFGKEGITDNPNFIVQNGGKFLIGTYNSTPPFSLSNQYEKRVTRGLIYEIDTSGIWREAFVSDTMRGGVRQLLINKDGDYICSSNFVRWYNYPETDDYIWHVHHMVFKLDKNFNLIWEKPYGLNFDFNYIYGLTRILSSQEEDGYILVGYQPNYPWTKELGPWNIEQEVVDSLKESGVPPMTIGILQKISEEGDSVWLRSFSVFSDTSFNYIEHKIHDMTYAPDGGYILYGTVDYPPRPGVDTVSNYNGWLLKVDKDGCFIPGCADTTDTTNIVNLIEYTQVMLYPNPTSDKLFVYQREAGLTRYTIHDISGAKVMEWTGDLPSHTYIVDVSDYKAGVYVLSVERVGSRSYKLRPSSKKFVVE